MAIRQLSEGMVNRIAAGEVVERPASVVKEPVENAPHAAPGRVEIVTDVGERRAVPVGEPRGWGRTDDGGEKGEVKPGALGEGTRVEVRDLFYATPARLKFLKTDRTESEAIREVVRRLAMSRPDVAFTLAGEERAPVT